MHGLTCEQMQSRNINSSATEHLLLYRFRDAKDEEAASGVTPLFVAAISGALEVRALYLLASSCACTRPNDSAMPSLEPHR